MERERFRFKEREANVGARDDISVCNDDDAVMILGSARFGASSIKANQTNITEKLLNLTAKARRVVLVPEAYTTQKCSFCRD